MTPQEAIQTLATHPKLVYLLVGQEFFFIEQILQQAKQRLVHESTGAFNFDSFEASEASSSSVMGAIRTVPMMATKRLVIVRGLERLNALDSEQTKKSLLDVLAEYVLAPIESTCLLLVASELDGRKKLALQCKKQGYLVTCDPLRREQLPDFLIRQAQKHGHSLPVSVANAIVDLTGHELSLLLDALERISLFVGPEKPITLHAVETCVARVSASKIWGIAESILVKDKKKVFQLFEENFNPSDRGLPIMGAIALSFRKLLRFKVLTENGQRVDDAAKESGIFKGYDTARALKNVSVRSIETVIRILAETDLALKSSRRTPQLIWEEGLIRMMN